MWYSSFIIKNQSTKSSFLSRLKYAYAWQFRGKVLSTSLKSLLEVTFDGFVHFVGGLVALIVAIPVYLFSPLFWVIFGAKKVDTMMETGIGTKK
jgi:hypothetical protein